jgi:hypothetical protein
MAFRAFKIEKKEPIPSFKKAESKREGAQIIYSAWNLLANGPF